jgi:hypothetical protein
MVIIRKEVDGNKYVPFDDTTNIFLSSGGSDEKFSIKID